MSTVTGGIRPAESAGFRIGLVLAFAIPVAVLAVFFVWPIAAMLARGFLGELGLDHGVDLSGFAEVLSRPRTQRVIAQTLAQAGAATVLSVLLGVPLAHVLYRLRLPGGTLLRALVIVPFVMPTVVVGIAFRSLLRDSGPLGILGLDESFAGIVMALTFFNIAVVVRTVGTTWAGLDGRVEDAARVLGAAPARVWLTITLPRLLPAIMAAASIVFLFCATAFGVVLVLGGARFGTVETEIWYLTTRAFDLRGAAVLSAVQLVLVVLLLWASAAIQRRAADGRGAQRRDRRVAAAASTRAAGWRDTPLIALSIGVGLFLLAPLIALVERSLWSRADQSWNPANYAALAGTGSRNALVVPAWQALGNSLGIALAGTVLAVGLGVLAAIVLSRPPRTPGLSRLHRGFDLLIMLPLGVSAVTLGFGFLIALDRAPFDLRSSLVLVPIAQALVALPLVLRTVLPVARGIDERQRESASVLGAGPWRVLAGVDLPILARPVLAASGFAFAVCLGEFGATSFLSRPDRPTLPVVIFRLLEHPGGDNFGMAMAASVVLAALTVAVMVAVERLRVGSVGAF